MNNLADSFWEQGKLADARKLLEEVLPQRIELFGKENLETLTTMNLMANVLSEEGNLNEGRRLHQEVFEGRKRILGLEHQDTLRAWHNVASGYLRAGKVDEGRKLNEEILNMRNRVLGPEHPDTLQSKSELAAIMARQGKVEESRKLLEENVALQVRVRGPKHPATLRDSRNLALVLHALAVEYRKRGQYPEEEQTYRRALELLENVAAGSATDPRSQERLADGQTRLAFILVAYPKAEIYKPGEAAELAQKAVQLAPQMKLSWLVLGMARYRTGNWKAAVEALDQSRDLSDNAGGTKSALLVSMERFYLAMAHWQQEQKDEARQWYGKAVEAMQKELSQFEDLVRLRSEAAELLGISAKQAPESKSE
jgi:tetratricopeptide (TPR) repeat protein